MSEAERAAGAGSARRGWNFFRGVPHARALNLEMVEAGDGIGVLKVPYDDALIGNPVTRVIHGGVITSLIDSACGMAIFTALPRMEPIATLDLRIDYMKPAVPGQDLYARSECYKLTRRVAFCRATAYQSDFDDPVATSVAAFMRHSSRPPAGGKRQGEA